MSRNKTIVLLIGGLSLVLASIFAAYSFRQVLKKPPLPVLGQVGSFVLTDADGKTFDSQQLYGKVWIANFFFTTCSDICPMMTKHMASLSRTFEQVPAVKLVSFTVNPENDSPQVLKAYSEPLNKGKGNWYFLTGKREDIQAITVERFKLGKIDEPIFHSSYFPLVDRTGNIRGYYEGTSAEDINRLFKDASVLLKERY